MKKSIIQDLVSYLASQQRYVKIAELCDHFGVSRRTIFYRIQQANDYLTQHNIPTIKNERGTGYLLDNRSVKLWQSMAAQESTQSLDRQDGSETQNRRLQQMLWRMISSGEALSINDLAIQLQVSRNTIIADFKKIKEQHPELGLTSTPNGHLLSGSENEQRRFVFHELQMDTHGTIADGIRQLTFPVIDDDKIKEDFLKLEQRINSKFTENAYGILILMLKFTINRISMGKLIQQADTTATEIEEVTERVVPAAQDFLKSNGVNTQNELIFFTELILCSQVSSINYIQTGFKDTMLDVTKQIIMRYDQIAGTKINSAEFVEALSNHLYATYFRCKYHFEFSAKVLNTIENQFAEMIKFVQIACQPLAKLIGKPISVNEIALICLYFISYNDIPEDSLTNFLDKTDGIKEGLESEVLLVCTSGISTSALLYSTLHRRYPLINFSRSLSIEKLEKIMRMPNRAKLIITTAPLNQGEFDVPVVNVQSVLNSRDSYKVEQVLRKTFPQLSVNQESSLKNILSIIRRNAQITNVQQLKQDLAEYLFPYDQIEQPESRINLTELVSSANVKIFDQQAAGDLEAVIRSLCWILTKEKITTAEYADDIITLIRRYGPYMLVSADTFLAHAAPSDHTKQVGLAIGILKTPMEIQVNNEVEKLRCVILLSPGFNHEHDKALAQLINIITNRNLYQQVLNAKNSRAAAQLIKAVYQE